ncbi:MAG: hypothetical protein IIA67_07935 [Planctomycetes bacterium]|nr:hypothetical protein [Planctomycetota bacterium]
MADSFDAYHEWLGIAPREQPANHYRLLGIELYEAKPNVIDGAADRQMAHLRTFQTGPRRKLCQRLLNEVSAARVLLLDPEKKVAYDEQLRVKLAERDDPQPRVAKAVPLHQAAAVATPIAKPTYSAPLQAATSPAPQISSAPSRRRGRRKQSAPWMALGIGGALLGIVVVIAAIAIKGGGEETADAEPAVRSPKSNSANAAGKSSAPVVTLPSGTDKSEPTAKKALNVVVPTSDDPPKNDPSKNDPSRTAPPVNPEDPFEVIDDKDLPRDDPPPVAKRPSKPPIPAAEALEKAAVKVREIFEVDRAITVEAKAKLARDLLAAAKETGNDPAAQYVMLRMVRDVSALYGDYAAAEQAIAEMSQRFDVDALAMRSEAAVQSLAAKVPADQRQQAARHALLVVRDFHAADRYKESRRMITGVLRAASRLKDKQMAADARQLRVDGEALAKRYAAVRPAFETLKTEPADPAANTRAGKYLCFVKGDWKRGLPMLAKGNDALLKDLAVREQRGVDKHDEQLAMADAWWKVAEEQPSRAGNEVRRHAAVWYRGTLSNLSGLDKARVQKRLDRAKPAAAEQAAKPPVLPADMLQFGGHRYKIVFGRITWSEAKKLCERAGGYLACVESEAESQAIAGLIARAGKLDKRSFVCLGGFKDRQGRWQWINGRRMSFTNFVGGEPNNSGGAEDRLAANLNGAWNDTGGSHPTINGFICEWGR